MNDTPYYDARVRAAEKDPAFESRQGAGAVIGIALFVEKPSKEGAA